MREGRGILFGIRRTWIGGELLALKFCAWLGGNGRLGLGTYRLSLMLDRLFCTFIWDLGIKKFCFEC